MESMLSGIGVIAALILSLQVGLFFTISMDELMIAEFRFGMIEEATFREFVHYQMVLHDIPLIYDLSTSSTEVNIFNATHALIGMPPEDFCVPSADGGFSDCWYFHKGTQAVEKVFHLTRNVFPIEKVTPWMVEELPPERSFTNRLMGFWSELSMYCLMMTLLGSILFYTALALSECREGEVEGDNRPTIYFNIVAVPVMLIAYFGLIMGIVCFYFAVTWINLIRAPQFWVTTEWSLYNWGRTIPTFITLCVLAVISLMMSNNYKYFQQASIRRGVVAPQEEVEEEREEGKEEEEER